MKHWTVEFEIGSRYEVKVFKTKFSFQERDCVIHFSKEETIIISLEKLQLLLVVSVGVQKVVYFRSSLVIEKANSSHVFCNPPFIYGHLENRQPYQVQGLIFPRQKYFCGLYSLVEISHNWVYQTIFIFKIWKWLILESIITYYWFHLWSGNKVVYSRVRIWCKI